MSKYNCPRCGYSTKFKSSFINHLKRKNICNPIVDDCSIEQICFLYNFDIHNFLPQNTTILPQKTTLLPQNTTLLPQKTTLLPKYDQNEKNINNALNCSYCNKILSRNDSLSRHLTTCTVKKKHDENKIMESQQLCLMKNHIQHKSCKDPATRYLLAN